MDVTPEKVLLGDAAVRDPYRLLDDYAEAGLATGYQKGILNRTLDLDAARPWLKQAIDDGAPLTLSEIEGLSTTALTDGDRYILLFGEGFEANTFAVDRSEMETLISLCVQRGAPATAAELKHLHRDVKLGVLY